MTPNGNHQTTNTLYLQFVLDKDKLYLNNFLDWCRNLRIVFKHERKSYVLIKPLPSEHPSTSMDTREAWLKHFNYSIDISRLMLEYIVLYLRRELEHFQHMT